MQSYSLLLNLVAKRLDELIAAHTRSLIITTADKHDRLAGKIEALSDFRKGLVQISRDFQTYDQVGLGDPVEDAEVIEPSTSTSVLPPSARAAGRVARR